MVRDCISFIPISFPLKDIDLICSLFQAVIEFWNLAKTFGNSRVFKTHSPKLETASEEVKVSSPNSHAPSIAHGTLNGSGVFAGIINEENIMVSSSMLSLNDRFPSKKAKCRQAQGRIQEEEAAVWNNVATCKGAERTNSDYQ